MSNFKYSLLEAYSFSGTFTFDVDGKTFVAGGKLNIEPNKISYFSLQFFPNDSFWVGLKKKSTEIFVPIVHAVFENNVFGTLQNVRLQMGGWSNGGLSFNGLVEHIVMNNYFNLDSQIIGINASLNLWEEFCFPGGFKATVKPSEKPWEINIGNNTNIRSGHTSMATVMNENEFINFLSFDPDTKDIAVAEIQIAFEKIKERTKQDHIFIYPRSDYREYLQFIKSTSLKDLSEILKDIQHFSNLLFILTYFPASPVSSDIVVSTETKEGKPYKEYYPWIMPIGINKRALQSSKRFSFLGAPITYPMLRNEWLSIVESWFEKREAITPFLDVLLNNLEGSSIQFEFTRSVDAVKEISKDTSKENGKAYYQYAIEKYAFDALKNKFLEIFNVTTYEDLGKQISDARANIVHRDDAFSSSYKKVESCAHSVDCFELVIISYIHAQIGVPDNLREKFQSHWLDRAKNKRYFKFTEEVNEN